jgi:hypothetical protein
VSGTRPLSTNDTSGISSARRSVAADSNQNKQVIWISKVSDLSQQPSSPVLLLLQIPRCFLHSYLPILVS